MATVSAVRERTEAERWAGVRDEEALWGDLRPELLEAVRTILETTMEDELAAELLATRYQRTPWRTDLRNGSYQRTLVTELGAITDLRVPRRRLVPYRPSFLVRAAHRTTCVDRVLRQAFLRGLSTRETAALGTFLRSFRWGHVRQLDRVSRELLGRAFSAGAGPGAEPLTIDLDSTICETYGLAKQGARHHGYTHVRGYHPLLAIAAGTGDVLMARLREGRAITARGAGHFLRETIGRVRAAGASGQLTVRADSGFYAHEVVKVCRAMKVRFSITIRQSPATRRLIEAIPEDAWTPIPYWLAGGADVAETTYVPFAPEKDAAPVRLIVRRVRPTPGSQLALLTLYDYHACITDREGATLVLETDHRRHAEIENAIRDLKYGVALNHLPSGKFAANGAWLAVQVIAHNLARWTARIGLGAGIVTTKTLRRRLFALAGRLTRSARRLTLHLPARWPWAIGWGTALARLRGIPLLA